MHTIAFVLDTLLTLCDSLFHDLTKEITPSIDKRLYQLRKALLPDNLIKS